MNFDLPAVRPESPLKDKKPPMTSVEATAEADRCLYCSDAPCIKACPTSIDIPTFIKKIASGNVRGSARTIYRQNILGASCSRVCPVEVLCEGACVYEAWQHAPIAIGRLQRYATDHGRQGAPLYAKKPATRRKVACIGAGPASLACAAYLALEGHEAVVFEQKSLPGGLGTTGIAPYKLKAADALAEIEWLLSLGRVRIETGKTFGKDVLARDLLAKYDAVFVGVGLGEDSKLGLPGEAGPGVVGATAWIEQLKTGHGPCPQLGRVLVVGGGNTAIDVAHEAALLGATEVTMVYRRTLADMSGYAHELAAARKDGVRVLANLVPTAVVREAGKIMALRVARARGGRPVAGTEHELGGELVVLAIGQSRLRAVARDLPGVALDANGCVIADGATCVTGNPKVYAGGDCINGGKEVVNAVADGRNAARAMMSSWKDEK